MRTATWRKPTEYQSRVDTRKWQPTVFYLTETDLRQLPCSNRNKMTIGGIPIRVSKGRHSMLYAHCGRGRRI